MLHSRQRANTMLPGCQLPYARRCGVLVSQAGRSIGGLELSTVEAAFVNSSPLLAAAARLRAQRGGLQRPKAAPRTLCRPLLRGPSGAAGAPAPQGGALDRRGRCRRCRRAWGGGTARGGAHDC